MTWRWHFRNRRDVKGQNPAVFTKPQDWPGVWERWRALLHNIRGVRAGAGWCSPGPSCNGGL